MSKLNSITQKHSLTISNVIPEIARMSLWLTGSLGHHGISRELQFKFDLCANEAVTNIISYAYPLGGQHEIKLKLSVDESMARLEIEDDGIAFNPLTTPEHQQPKSLKKAKIGGLGIDLMRHYMDAIDYQRDSEKNRLRLTVKLPEHQT